MILIWLPDMHKIVIVIIDTQALSDLNLVVQMSVSELIHSLLPQDIASVLSIDSWLSGEALLCDCLFIVYVRVRAHCPNKLFHLQLGLVVVHPDSALLLQLFVLSLFEHFNELVFDQSLLVVFQRLTILVKDSEHQDVHYKPGDVSA